MDYISTILARSPKIDDDERYRRILSYIEECNLHSCLAIALLYIGYEPKDHAKNIFIADHLLSDEEKNEWNNTAFDIYSDARDTEFLLRQQNYQRQLETIKTMNNNLKSKIDHKWRFLTNPSC